MTCECGDCVGRAGYLAERAMYARRQTVLRVLFGLLVFVAVVLAVGCRPPYVQQPPPPDASTGGAPALGTGGSASAGVPGTGGSASDAECTWRPSGRAVHTPSNRVAGGTPSPEGAHPYVCRVETGQGQPYCTASLIGPRSALCAAHCQVEPGDAIRCGANDLSDPTAGETLVVLETRNHARWGGSVGGGYDLAVLRLTTESTIDPVPLADVVPEQQTAVMLVGYGAERAGAGMVDVQLRALAPVVNRWTCEQYYGGAVTFDSLCVGGDGAHDTCPGDSGGPVLWLRERGYEQAGVTSFGGTCPTVGVYTAVAEHLPWIRACAGLP